MSLYTVHQFYFQVNELLDKYKAKKPDHKLRVNFEIQEGPAELNAAFYVSYGHKKCEPVDRIFAVGYSPGIALQKFEDELRKLSADNAMIKSMAIEVNELISEPAERTT